MTRWLTPLITLTAVLLTACGAMPTSKPAGWAAPEALVAPSSFTGVHGLAIDRQGRLLAGSVVGNAIWEVDRQTGAAKILIGGPEGQADDIAIGPHGQMAWTNYLQGAIRYRENDSAPIKVLAQGLPGLNSLDFDRRNGRLYATQVFLGDALYEIDTTGATPPRLIAKDLAGPVQMTLGPDAELYVSEAAGNVQRIDLKTGAKSVVASGLALPQGLAFTPWGTLVVAEGAAGRITEIDLAAKQSRPVAQSVPIGLSGGPGMPPPYVATGVAVGADGAVYFSANRNNAIYRVRPQR